MSFEYEGTATTTASPADVWALWSDVGSWHCWDPAVQRVALEGHFAEGAAGTLCLTGDIEAPFVLEIVEPGTRFLDRIKEAYDRNPALPSLLVDDYFRDAVANGQEAWRRVVATAATVGVPAPGFSAALSYYDGLRAERLPAALIQGLRDLFGAHTYKRVDREGSFHLEWSGDRSESTQ